jgi:hypothetical protein
MVLDNKYFKVCKRKNIRLKKVMERGDELLKEELDIINIIKAIRKIKND